MAGNILTQFDSSGKQIFNSTLPTETPTNQAKESIRLGLAHAMRNSIARTNRFIVEFSSANGFQRHDTARLLLSAIGTSIPGKSFSSIDNQRIGGYYTPYPYVRTFTNQHDISFRVGYDMFERLLFDIWQDDIMNPITQNFNYPDNYTSDIRIHQLDTQHNQVYTIELQYAYPLKIDSLSLDASQMNGHHTQTVTFGYRRHVVVGLNDLESFLINSNISSSSFEGDTPQIFGLNGQEILGKSIHRQPLELGSGGKKYTGILGLLDKLGKNRELIENVANRIRTYNKGLGNPLGDGTNNILKTIEGLPRYKSL